jgi:hypothetical protein
MNCLDHTVPPCLLYQIFGQRGRLGMRTEQGMSGCGSDIKLNDCFHNVEEGTILFRAPRKTMRLTT